MVIKDYLCKEAVLLGLEAATNEEVIRALGEKLREEGYVKDDFVEAALEREANLPNVDVEYVNKSALGLATLKEDVVFYHMVENDVEVPCRLVIMLALDKPKSQIEMLQSVATLLQNPDVIKKLIGAESIQEIFTILS